MFFPLWDMAFLIVITLAPAMWFFAMVSLLASIVTSTDMGFMIRTMMVQVVANAMHANLAQAFHMILQKEGTLK